MKGVDQRIHRILTIVESLARQVAGEVFVFGVEGF